MITLPTLYKRTNTGATQIWFVEMDRDKYRTTSGQQFGKKVTSAWTVAKPKNEGKANGTSGAAQAEAEVKAMYTKQMKKDYRENLDEIDNIERFKPMLAAKWSDRKDKITQSVVHMQPKLDGIRCIAMKSGLWTRTGEPILGAPHILEALQPYFSTFPGGVLDGELYNHDLKDDFNTIVSSVKKQKPTPEDLEVSRKNIQYWIYDLPSNSGDFEQRSLTLRADFEALSNHLPEGIVLVETQALPVSDVDASALQWIEQGYEGAMVRLRGTYENKRSKTLLKWKEFQDEEFKIVDIQEGDGNRAGMAARVILKLNDKDATFGAGLIGSVPYCTQLLAEKDKWIGKLGTVVFQHYTPDGVPRFPKFKAVRLGY